MITTSPRKKYTGGYVYVGISAARMLRALAREDDRTIPSMAARLMRAEAERRGHDPDTLALTQGAPRARIIPPIISSGKRKSSNSKGLRVVK